MRCADELDCKRSEGDDVARFDAMQQHVTQDSMLVQLAFRQTVGEVRSVNRNVELFQDVRQRAKMIFVTVRKNDCRNLVPVLFKNFEIGNRNIYAIDTLFGKTHARIDDNHLVAKAQQRAVHPELADTAEGNDFEDARHLSFYSTSHRFEEV